VSGGGAVRKEIEQRTVPEDRAGVDGLPISDVRPVERESLVPPKAEADGLPISDARPLERETLSKAVWHLATAYQLRGRLWFIQPGPAIPMPV